MDSNASIELHTRWTNNGSASNYRNLNQVPQFIDLTDDGVIDLLIVDLTNVPNTIVLHSPDCSENLPAQIRGDPQIIDLTEDSVENAKKTNDESVNVSDESTSQNVIPPDLEDEFLVCTTANARATEYSTIQESENFPVPFNRLSNEEDCHVPFNRLSAGEENSNEKITLHGSNAHLSLPAVDDSTESHLCEAMTSDESNRYASQMDVENAVEIPVIYLTEESPDCPMASTRVTECLTTQEIEDSPASLDRLSAEEQHSYESIVLDEWNHVLSSPVFVDSTESLLCVATTSDETSRCASPMDNPKGLNDELESLQKKISTLENSVVDLNDDNNSIFLHIDVYKARACQIYELINNNSGKSETRRKGAIQFNGTPCAEYNRKLEKYVNKKRRLPMFKNALKWLKCFNQSNNLNLSQEDCYRFAEESLSTIGKKLQNERKASLSETFAYYTNNQTDPAEHDPVLMAKLNGQLNNSMLQSHRT